MVVEVWLPIQGAVSVQSWGVLRALNCMIHVQINITPSHRRVIRVFVCQAISDVLITCMCATCELK